MEIPAVIQEWIRAEPVCVMRPFHVKNPIKKNLGSLMAFYYRGASSLMETMVNTVPDTTIYRIGKIFGSTSKAKSAIASSLGENPILIVIFTVWLLLAGFFLVLIGLHFVCRLLYSRKSMQLSDQRILWATLSFGLCFVTSLIGLTFYSTSLSRIREGVEDFPLQLNRTTSDFSGFILYLNETINCHHENEYEDLLKEINEVLNEIRGKVQEIKSMMKVYELQKISDELKALHASTSRSPYDMTFGEVKYREFFEPLRVGLVKTLANCGITLQDLIYRGWLIGEKLDQGLKELDQDKQKAFEAIIEYKNAFSEAVAFFNESTTRVHREIAKVVSSKNCSRISDILGYMIYFPIILMILTTAGLAVIIGSWKFYLADVFGSGNFYKTSERFESLKSNHDTLVRMAASALAGAGYVAMVIGALLCVIVAFCFVMAFATMLVCMGFFLDDDLRLFNAVPNLQYRAKFGTQEIKYSLYYTFYKCKNGYQFFDATNGSRLMASTELERKFQQSRRKDLALQLQKYHMGPDRIEHALSEFSELAKLREEFILKGNAFLYTGLPLRDFDWRHAHEFYQEFRDIIEPIQQLVSKSKNTLEQIGNTIAKKEFRDDQGKSLQKSVSTMYRSLLDAFSNIFKAVGELSSHCEHIMRIWFVLGGYVCDWISAPAQGLWVASMICVLASSATYHAFFNLARFLYEHTESAQEAYQREKLYLAKLDFVHRKMLKQDVPGSAPGSASASPEAATVNAVTQSEQPSAQISANDAGKTEKKSDFLKDLKEMLMRIKKNKN
uniref:Coiled-coil protein n=1 Tax=Haemonchus contortus TaxID=6289 RepID=A0A7I4YH51_HAECO